MSLGEIILISNLKDKLLIGPLNDDMYDVNQYFGESADVATSPANASDDYSDGEGDYSADDEIISGPASNTSPFYPSDIYSEHHHNAFEQDTDPSSEYSYSSNITTTTASFSSCTVGDSAPPHSDIVFHTGDYIPTLSSEHTHTSCLSPAGTTIIITTRATDIRCCVCALTIYYPYSGLIHQQCGHTKRCYNCEVVPQVAVWSCDCTLEDAEGSKVAKRYIGSAGGKKGECKSCGKQYPAMAWKTQWLFVDEVEFDWEEYKKRVDRRWRTNQVIYVEATKEERDTMRRLINALPVYK